MKKWLQKTWTIITNFDLWDWRVAYALLSPTLIGNIIRTGSPFYFYATNPGIETGGMLVESKYDILKQMPEQYVPKGALLARRQLYEEDVLQVMKKLKIDFPIIIKPNNGERGRLVKQIKDMRQLQKYLRKARKASTSFILQDYVDYDLEVGIFYRRFPDQEHGEITSFISKKLLTVTGDGKSTVEELMLKNPFTLLQLEQKRHMYEDMLKTIPYKDKVITLSRTASHEYGVAFIDEHENISKELTKTIDYISKQVEGFYYGRYDIKTPSLDALKKGVFKVIELNGAKGEPTRIFDRKHSLLNSYRILRKHWLDMSRIAKLNAKKGHTYPGIFDSTGYKQVAKLFRLKKEQ